MKTYNVHLEVWIVADDDEDARMQLVSMLPISGSPMDKDGLSLIENVVMRKVEEL